MKFQPFILQFTVKRLKYTRALSRVHSSTMPIYFILDHDAIMQ